MAWPMPENQAAGFVACPGPQLAATNHALQTMLVLKRFFLLAVEFYPDRDAITPLGATMPVGVAQ